MGKWDNCEVTFIGGFTIHVEACGGGGNRRYSVPFPETHIRVAAQPTSQ
jgi:hypothetical protein